MSEQAPRSTSVLIVDDQALVRLGFRMLLAAQDGVEVVGEAGDGAAAVSMVASLDPDVVLMDVRMPVMDGVEATRRITAAARSKVLVLTTFDLDEHAFAALRAGASGFLLKDALPEELVAALRAVADGDAVLTPRVTRLLIASAGEHLPGGAPTAADGRLASLTEREREVLVEVARGRSNTEIAARLFLSEATVKGHVGKLFVKLAVRDRVQAVVWAYRAGLVSPDDPDETGTPPG